MQKLWEDDLQKVYETAKKQKLDEAKVREQKYLENLEKLNQNLKDIEAKWN